MPSEAAPVASTPVDAAPRRLHRFTLFFGALRVARAFTVPAVLGALRAGGNGAEQALAVGLGILSVPALLAAVAKYLTFRYRLKGDELVLDSGIVSRSRRVIPLARVQNIDVRQSWLERLCGVAELRVETAGGERPEAVLSVLGRREAEALRAELLRRRQAAPAAGAGPAAPVEVLAHLSPADLALAGATANQAGLVAAALAGSLQILDDLPIDIPRPEIDPTALVPGLPAAGVALAVLAVLLFFALLGWFFSVVGAVVGYHDFALEKAGGELRKRYGLLGRREGSVPLSRVQAIRVEESLLRRPLGLAALKVETAGAGPGQRGGAEAFLPLARQRDVPRLVAAVFGDLDYAALRFRPVHPRARRRFFLRFSAPIVLLAGALALLADPAWLFLLTLEPLAFLLAHKEYRHRGYARAPGYIAARAGFFNRITWLIPERRIQTLHVTETPFQRRHGLATLVVDTAAGGRRVARVVDLGREEASRLLEAGVSG